MVKLTDFHKVSDYIFEIPRSFRSDMQVAGRVYATRKMMEQIVTDRTTEQLVNMATLRGIQKYAVAMPDAHEGYGAPVGGVFATDLKEGIISPGAIGYDINCGVRLLLSDLKAEELKKELPDLVEKLFHRIPSGLGRGGEVRLAVSQLDEVLTKGAEWAVVKGYGIKMDPERLEEAGRFEGADASKVSERAKKRGSDQVGTIGSGNHFVEVQKVEQIFDDKIAGSYGLFVDQVTFLIHTGSRGLGHQVATDYIFKMMTAMPKYQISIPDRELACVPFSSPEGQDYFAAMQAAANFAWANRQIVTYLVREVFGRELTILYDVAHNIAKIEEYPINGKAKKMVVHRKGATRAFGPGSAEISEIYRDSGQPVIIPGSMGTASFVLAGLSTSAEAFGSTCHGAGRRMSRKEAKRQVRGYELKEQLAKRGIIARSQSMTGLAEEAPLAYKDVDEVVDVVDKAGLAKRVARLVPLGVIKG